MPSAALERDRARIGFDRAGVRDRAQDTERIDVPVPAVLRISAGIAQGGLPGRGAGSEISLRPPSPSRR